MHTKNLRKIRKSHTQTAGGKGAALGELMYAGIPVPPGFVVTTQAFAHFLRANHITHPTAVLILGGAMPTAVQKEIMQEYTQLGAKYVAVRSSATTEDGTHHAWAGQLESYVPTREADIIANIKKCWASLYSPRAIAYRANAGLGEAEVSVAVVVQALIDSEHAGIAFSMHPITGSHAHVVVESVQGLGEAAVGGHVTPDTFVLSKYNGEIVELYEGTQSKKLVQGTDGVAEWRPVTNGAALSPAQLKELTAHVRAIETHFGQPMDVEWTYAHNEFYIVQSRPITA